MMFADRLFNNYSNEEVHVVQLPYKGEEISMYFLKSIDGDLQELLADFSTSKFAMLKEKLTNEELFISLRKFEVEYENKEMVDRLKDFGIIDIFSKQANLSQMSEKDDLVISRVIHKTFLSVSEKGTEGAAATVVGAINTSSPPRAYFDSPFMFIIADNVTNNFLFKVRVSNPKEK
jgi:serpin B